MMANQIAPALEIPLGEWMKLEPKWKKFWLRKGIHVPGISHKEFWTTLDMPARPKKEQEKE